MTDSYGKAPATAVLASHYWQTGAGTALRDYLIPRTERFLFIGHPLFVDSTESYCELYSKGNSLTSTRKPGPRGPARYLAELYRTVRWGSVKGKPFDTFIAADSLLALAGIYLRVRGRVRQVILYTVDYSPSRFRNPLLNRIYHAIDSFAVRHVDLVWSVSEQIVSARTERHGHKPATPQMVVPHGANFDRVARVTLDRADAYRIGFLGHLLEKQGVQALIKAMPRIQARVPRAALTIIGDGPYAGTLRELSKQLGLDATIEFTGAIEDHQLVESRLAGCALAVAPYVPDPLNCTQFADPGKIKTYLACGLPIVLTGVPPIAALVESRGAGRVVEYDVDALADAIADYLSDRRALEVARAAATELGSEFEWRRIFSDAWTRTPQGNGKAVAIGEG
jgi:glycosyltransferase involved in cell wall biosynthesis